MATGNSWTDVGSITNSMNDMYVIEPSNGDQLQTTNPTPLAASTPATEGGKNAVKERKKKRDSKRKEHGDSRVTSNDELVGRRKKINRNFSDRSLSDISQESETSEHFKKSTDSVKLSSHRSRDSLQSGTSDSRHHHHKSSDRYSKSEEGEEETRIYDTDKHQSRSFQDTNSHTRDRSREDQSRDLQINPKINTSCYKGEGCVSKVPRVSKWDQKEPRRVGRGAWGGPKQPDSIVGRDASKEGGELKQDIDVQQRGDTREKTRIEGLRGQVRVEERDGQYTRRDDTQRIDSDALWNMVERQRVRNRDRERSWDEVDRQKVRHIKGQQREKDSRKSGERIRQWRDPLIDYIPKHPRRVLTTNIQWTYQEKIGDLFDSLLTSSLAHCVSCDLHMGKGIATVFKEKFQRVEELKSQGAKPGGVAILKDNERYIYYLVTKWRYYHKPTNETLYDSLFEMRQHIVANSIRELNMPLIGCGLDQLDWKEVSVMITELFHDIPISITIYRL